MGLKLLQECFTVTLEMTQTQSNLTRGRKSGDNISKISIHRNIAKPPLNFNISTQTTLYVLYAVISCTSLFVVDFQSEEDQDL